jgi:L-ascorbate metabolism protein UlaG (beta-lactamase superfamily)
MKVTYLYHSGFLVETAAAAYLFDYIKGDLPALPAGLPLYVFASHSHRDHYVEAIYRKPIAGRVKNYILAMEIASHPDEDPHRRRGYEEYKDKILLIGPHETLYLDGDASTVNAGAHLSDTGAGAGAAAGAGSDDACSAPAESGNSAIRVQTLLSTDEGVAFCVYDPEGAIYHAGDLHWWHWEGEPDEENREMGENYRKEIDLLSGEHFKAAFVPLDPRLDNAYWYGMRYFADHVKADHIFPMHSWKNYALTDRYLKEHGGEDRIHRIEKEGQTFVI